jgi:hypothetical protein
MLLLTYTPRSDAEARDYNRWLREIDNPSSTPCPGSSSTNWKIVAQHVGTVPFTHFDTMLVEDEVAVERIWSNSEVQRFADGWRELWALNPGADEMSPNYQVAICREIASGDADLRTRNLHAALEGAGLARAQLRWIPRRGWHPVLDFPAGGR